MKVGDLIRHINPRSDYDYYDYSGVIAVVIELIECSTRLTCMTSYKDGSSQIEHWPITHWEVII